MQWEWQRVMLDSTRALLAPASCQYSRSVRTITHAVAYSHPADRAPAKHTIIVSDPSSSPIIHRASTTDLHALDPSVEAAHNVARIRRLLEVGAFGFEDLVFHRRQPLVKLALLLKDLSQVGTQGFVVGSSGLVGGVVARLRLAGRDVFCHDERRQVWMRRCARSDGGVARSPTLLAVV